MYDRLRPTASLLDNFHQSSVISYVFSMGVIVPYLI